jgi:hypothetical protein
LDQADLGLEEVVRDGFEGRRRFVAFVGGDGAGADVVLVGEGGKEGEEKGGTWSWLVGSGCASVPVVGAMAPIMTIRRIPCRARAL